VERYEDGHPKREGNDLKYKTGKDEFLFVKREPIDKVKAKDNLIQAIVDPLIKDLVTQQKIKTEIKDYRGNVIRHVRVKANAGKEVKERVNYISQYDYKNKFYSEAGSLPYAILLQRNNIEKIMIPIASFELAKAYKKNGSFVIDKYLKKYDIENNTKYTDYPDKKLLRVGQKVLVLKEDTEYEKRKGIDFQTKRLYVITQFSDGSIWLKYHLDAQSKDEIKGNINVLKDMLLRKYEIREGINEVVEDSDIQDNKMRKEDYENRRYRFDTIGNSFRLKTLSEKIGLEKTKEIKNELDRFKAIPGSIEIEGNTPLLKMASKNWNFIFEGEDFEISLLGKIKWIERVKTKN
jgi:CRISPR-associated endonuclease Csn1